MLTLPFIPPRFSCHNDFMPSLLLLIVPFSIQSFSVLKKCKIPPNSHEFHKAVVVAAVVLVVVAERRSVCIVATGRALHTTGFILHLNWSCLDWKNGYYIQLMTAILLGSDGSANKLPRFLGPGKVWFRRVISL